MPELAPLISIAIPTWHRLDLVVRAVRSALGQTHQALEVIVVVDGPDDGTLRALHEINDSRVKIKPLPLNLGIGDSQCRSPGSEKSLSGFPE